MKGVIERYLDRALAVADIRDGERESQIRQELRDHIEQKADALKSQGYGEAEALLKAIEDHGSPVLIGYRLRPWRLIDVRLRGTARGVIAIGPRARGIVALGGVAIGIVAFGGVAIGAVSFGGLALALLFAWGGLAGGAIAYGGFALGLVAFGGMAVGGIAAGGGAAGLWVPGAGQTLWSHFNWHTVPAWWRGIGQYLSYDPRSAQDRQAFMRFVGILSVATFVIIGAMSAIQGVMTAKESRRLRAIDPSVLE